MTMFHVPESARVTRADHPILGSIAADGCNGAFTLPSPEPSWTLVLLASDGDGWEHVSVHAERERARTVHMRTPTWKEMVFVKAQFWDDEDEVVQFHPKRSQYVNLHPHTLHLWRPIGVPFPTPPADLIGPR